MGQEILRDPADADRDWMLLVQQLALLEGLARHLIVLGKRRFLDRIGRNQISEDGAAGHLQAAIVAGHRNIGQKRRRDGGKGEPTPGFPNIKAHLDSLREGTD
jgi:hypothetical protein